MPETFLKRFRYNKKANSAFIRIFESEDSTSESSQSIFSHILNAHLVWLNRMLSLDNVSIPNLWQTHSTESFPGLNKICFDKTEWSLQTEQFGQNLKNTIQYKNSKGQQYENSIEEVYFHILMHSMYHRGQVAKLFRKDDINPPVTDFIFEMRDKRTNL